MMEAFFSLVALMIGFVVFLGCLVGSITLVASGSVALGIVALVVTLVVIFPAYIAIMVELES